MIIYYTVSMKIVSKNPPIKQTHKKAAPKNSGTASLIQIKTLLDWIRSLP